MEVIPAIDLRQGQVVRLYKGDFGKETIYSENPTKVAQEWERSGATRIHIVDLDGAKEGLSDNLKAISNISNAVDIDLQMGGGIRKLETAKNVIALGIQRIILGTVAIENPNLVRKACEDLGPDSVIVGLDARKNNILTKGWQKRSSTTTIELMREMVSLGVHRFIYTDVDRDGTLEGPNLGAISELMEKVQTPLIASGGISSISNLEQLASLGVEGAIVGVALYERKFDLHEAIEKVK